MLAYRGEVPWHGLGFSVGDLATGDEMLVTAKLNWPVECRKIAVAVPAGKGTAWSAEKVANYKAISRGDTGEVFTIATGDYHPVQNKDIVDFFGEYCAAGNAKLETVGGLKGGRVVWALAKLAGTDDSVGAKGVDKVEGYMLLATSHDGSIRTIGMPTEVRVVCWNTLSAAVGRYLTMRGEKVKIKRKQAAEEGVFLMKHTRKWSAQAAAEAKQTMGMAIEQIQATNALARELAKYQIDDEGRIEYVVRVMTDQKLIDEVVADKGLHIADGKGILTALLEVQEKETTEQLLGTLGKQVLAAITNSPGADLITAKDTLWGCANGVSYFTDHIRCRTQDRRLWNAWFGGCAQLKQHGMAVAAEMAGIKIR